MKSARAALTDKAADRQAALKAAVSSIYRAAAKNIIKKGTAERRVSRLMKAFAKTSA
ncbi:30S ribosomal protein S20 [Myxococcota bacterium]|nr:30S ribosomal protein S20 [Myxococcota bacterium]